MPKSLGWYKPELLVLKIELVDSDPLIWRRVEVDSGLTLHDLHYVIQFVFAWTDSHLYQFLVPPGGQLTQAALRDAARFASTPPGLDLDDDEIRPADQVMIGQVFTAQCRKIVYEYDFGDSWEHLVTLESRAPGGGPGHMPRCVAGENAAPQDDMGGIVGYYDFVAALRDPAHDMHEEAVEYLGEDFDPTRFDVEESNRRLARAFKPPPKRARKTSAKQKKR